ncbi:FCD domain-containing protein [Telmatospirillum siberiense]|uniref:Transcriptional regulator n=1 Tax=Telmatospirillum siberiense TaxID=382514 RepID=A0A2N3PZQ6_9PROT|nr:FCD domain-containing protein [Telmatospirillum siberiense]PKU25897.1 transcriptional regulator [Telmatospirillum siberiense]
MTEAISSHHNEENQQSPLAGLLKSHPETAFDYLEFRFIAAGMSAQMAAERASEKERARITRAFETVVAASEMLDTSAEYEADREFHLSIYAASHNAVMEHVMRNVFVMLHQDVFYDRRQFHGRAGVRELLLRQHKAIYDAVMAREPERARRAAENHVLYIRDTLQESRVAEQRAAVALRRSGRASLVQMNDVET